MMVESRGAFGFLGNILPAGLNAFTGAIGWFIVNSVSGAFALQALGGIVNWNLPFWLTFLVIVVAQVLIATFGHNFIHLFERWALPLLGVVFALATVIILTKANFGVAANPGPIGHFGAFTLMLTAVFGYAAGWNPYAADYTRYMAPTVNRQRVGFWAAAGVFISCVVIELAGAALAAVPGTKWGPNDIPTVQLSVALPNWLYYLTLLCIAVGAVAANAINIYSGTMSLVAVGIREMGLTLRQRRAALAVLAGVLGYVIGIAGQANVGPGSKYESFLLLISYWIGCWLAVVFVDYWVRKGEYGDESLFFNTSYQRWQGFAAMAIGLIVSVGLFGNVYGVWVGPIPNNNGGIGDITFFVGFVLTAVLYYVFQMVGGSQKAPSAAAGSRA
jgi:purine-cytosine permease-like protein